MKIMNQDKTMECEFTNIMDLNYNTIIEKDIIMGINLYLNDNLLGTFETIIDIKNEINSISRCRSEQCQISEFNSYNGDDDFKDLMV